MNKRRVFPLLVIALLFVLTGCQVAGAPLSAAMVEAGGQINGMSLTTGAASAPPLWSYCSLSQESNHIKTFNCRVPILPTLAIGHIFLVADEALTNMKLSNLEWELSIDNQPVDLESFGTFDYVLPSMAKSASPVREVFKKSVGWNVVLTNLNPGEHTLRFLAQNNADSYSWLVHLVIEPADGPDVSSVPFPLHS